MSSSNEALVRRWFDEMNKGRAHGLAMPLLADDYVQDDPETPVTGRQPRRSCRRSSTARARRTAAGNLA